MQAVIRLSSAAEPRLSSNVRIAFVPGEQEGNNNGCRYGEQGGDAGAAAAAKAQPEAAARPAADRVERTRAEPSKLKGLRCPALEPFARAKGSNAPEGEEGWPSRVRVPAARRKARAPAPRAADRARAAPARAAPARAAPARRNNSGQGRESPPVQYCELHGRVRGSLCVRRGRKLPKLSPQRARERARTRERRIRRRNARAHGRRHSWRTDSRLIPTCLHAALMLPHSASFSIRRSAARRSSRRGFVGVGPVRI